MYKLFLTFRYLTRKAIVIFPILVVWLCVMMLIIVTSIMGGFVGRVLDANRNLFGDIVVDAQSLQGWPYYEQLQAEIQKMPEVALVTPTVKAYGLINLPEYRHNNVAQIIGVDPAARALVSSWGRTLFHQYTAPLEAADDLAPALSGDVAIETKAAGTAPGTAGAQATAGQAVAAKEGATGAQLVEYASKQLEDAVKHEDDLLMAGVPPTLSAPQVAWRVGACAAALCIIAVLIVAMWWLPAWGRWLAVLGIACMLVGVGFLAWNIWAQTNAQRQHDLLEDARDQARATRDRLERTVTFAGSLQSDHRYKTRQDIVDALMPKAPSFTPPEEAVQHYGSRENMPQDGGCIIGVDVVPLAQRDRRGNYQRDNELSFSKAILTVVPVTPKGGLSSKPATGQFVIVDDSHTGMYEVDTTFVYAPFKKVQEMANMQPQTNAEDGSLVLNPDGTPVQPARCSELQVKLKDNSNSDVIRDVTQRINRKISELAQTHDELRGLSVIAKTSEERQARYIEAVRNEKRLITFILGLMSLVVVVVIFLIFYMIVRDKTRDIGIIKALGGSEEGVAGIFMMYGLFIGLVGGLLGLVTGVLFVWHTNEIHEWIFRTTGIMIWNRSVYMFDRIPDTVYWPEVLGYVAAAVLAGLIGALVPAIVAGFQDPVRAVRFE